MAPAVTCGRKRIRIMTKKEMLGQTVYQQAINATAAAEAAKDLRQLVFSHLQGKYEYIMLITKPQNP